MNFKITFISAFTFLLACTLSVSLHAQKKKQKKEEEQEITKYERANAEYLFIEAQKYFLLEDYQRSLAFLDQSLEIDKKNDAAFFKIAEIKLITEAYDDGIEAVQKAIALKNNNKYYYILSAQLYKSKNDLKGAAAQYEAMVANTLDYKEYLLDVVNVYTELADYKNAIRMLNLTESQFRTPGKYFRQRTDLLVKDNKADEAITYLNGLLEKSPEKTELKAEYADLLARHRSGGEAINFLESLRRRESVLDLLLMQLYLDGGRWESALPLAKSAFEDRRTPLSLKTDLINTLASGPLTSENLTLIAPLIAQLYEQNPNEKAIMELAGRVYGKMATIATDASAREYRQKSVEAFSQLKAIDPSDFKVWQSILNYEFEQEAWEQLLSDSEASLDYFPNQGLFYFYFGSANLYLEDLGEARSLFNQALKLSFSNDTLKSRIYGKMGEMAFLQNQAEPAKQHFEQGLSLIRLPELINNYSLALALRKIDLDLANRLADELLALEAGQLKYVKTKAFALFQSDQFAESKQVLEPALQQMSGQVDGPVLELYGDILIKLDMVEQAVAQWQKAKELGNTSPKLDQKIETKQYFE